MAVADKIAALFETLTQADIEAMAPAERERFAFLCSRFAKLATVQPTTAPKASGVLADVRDGRRGE
jgi:hypothetical protein